MKKIIAGVCFALILSGFMCGVLSIVYAWTIWLMAVFFTIAAIACIIVNET